MNAAPLVVEEQEFEPVSVLLQVAMDWKHKRAEKICVRKSAYYSGIELFVLTNFGVKFVGDHFEFSRK